MVREHLSRRNVKVVPPHSMRRIDLYFVVGYSRTRIPGINIEGEPPGGHGIFVLMIDHEPGPQRWISARKSIQELSNNTLHLHVDPAKLHTHR